MLPRPFMKDGVASRIRPNKADLTTISKSSEDPAAERVKDFESLKLPDWPPIHRFDEPESLASNHWCGHRGGRRFAAPIPTTEPNGTRPAQLRLESRHPPTQSPCDAPPNRKKDLRVSS